MADIEINPSGVGFAETIDAVYGVPDHWDACSDVPSHDGDTTYVYQIQSASSGVDLFEMENTALSGAITNVRLSVVLKQSGSGASAQHYLRTHDTNYSWATPNPGASYSTYNKDLTTNPFTGTAWTWTEINAMQVGVALLNGASSEVRCTQVAATITYAADTTITPGTASLILTSYAPTITITNFFPKIFYF